MVIKWKNWTALLPVKIVSFLLVPVLAAVALTTTYQLVIYGRNLDLTFAKLDNNSYFDSTQLGWWQVNSLTKLLIYEDEQAIREGRYVQIQAVTEQDKYVDWDYKDYNAYNHRALEAAIIDEREEDGIVEETEEYTYTAGQYLLYDMMWESTTYVDASELEWCRRDRINDQLYEFRELQDTLAQWEADGMLYYVTDGTRVLTNVKDSNEGFFTALPAYRIIRDGYSEKSSLRNYWNYQSSYTTGIDVYVGYNQASIDAFNSSARQIQATMRNGIVAPICAFLGAFVALVIFLSGVGRQFGDRRSVHLSVLDRPLLDISFVILGLYLIVLAYICSELSYYLFRNYEYYESAADNLPPIRQVATWFGVFSAASVVPILWWLGNLFKRFKDGSWWQHTLCCKIVRLCKEFFGSMWAGVHLTGKALAVSAVVILAAVWCAFFPALLFVFAPAVIVLLLQFARRLSLLQQGAELAVKGEPCPPMLNLRGTLGGIAAAVGSVSAGIGQAVEARLKSERMKTELITNVSHDIRTPLTSLITYTDLLKNEGLDSEHAEEYLDVLVQKAQRLKCLTDELFEAAKAATGNVEVHPELLDLAALVRQSLGEHDERVRESGLQFVLNLPEHALVIADGRLLSRVMENLLSNVFKYALPNSRVYVDIFVQTAAICMEIKNISATQLNMDPTELTERFTRGDAARSGDGSGLGLAIVQSFVEAMEGAFLLSIDGDLFKAAVSLPPSATNASDNHTF